MGLQLILLWSWIVFYKLGQTLHPLTDKISETFHNLLFQTSIFLKNCVTYFDPNLFNYFQSYSKKPWSEFFSQISSFRFHKKNFINSYIIFKISSYFSKFYKLFTKISITLENLFFFLGFLNYFIEISMFQISKYSYMISQISIIFVTFNQFQKHIK